MKNQNSLQSNEGVNEARVLHGTWLPWHRHRPNKGLEARVMHGTWLPGHRHRPVQERRPRSGQGAVRARLQELAQAPTVEKCAPIDKCRC